MNVCQADRAAQVLDIISKLKVLLLASKVNRPEPLPLVVTGGTSFVPAMLALNSEGVKFGPAAPIKIGPVSVCGFDRLALDPHHAGQLGHLLGLRRHAHCHAVVGRGVGRNDLGARAEDLLNRLITAACLLCK